MAQPQPPIPAKFFIAVLYHDPHCLERAIDEARNRWGGIDFQGEDHPFDVTAYYEPEMGASLRRRIVSIETLHSPVMLVDMKLGCNDLEERLGSEGGRRVNLDAGYLDHNKVVLASAKEAGQKIYLDKGIYADLAGRYKAGRYQPFEWSFPDFRDGRYDGELLKIRALYLAQVRQWRKQTPGTE